MKKKILVSLFFRLIFNFEVVLSTAFQSVDYGRMAEILVQRAGSQDEFTRLTAITWVRMLTCMVHHAPCRC